MANDFRNLVTDSNHDGIDPKRHEGFLTGIQGNILAHHARGYAAHVKLTFDKASIREALQWIRGFRPTSAWEEHKERPPLFKMLAFTKAGYDMMGVPPRDQPRDPAFRQSLRTLSSGAAYSVNPADPLQSIHAMAIIAADHPAEIVAGGSWDPGHNQLKDGLVDPALVARVEWGNLLWTDGGTNGNSEYGMGRKPKKGQGYHIEHFGFHDGIGNPRFYAQTDEEKSQEAKSRLPQINGQWNTFSPLSLVLAEEPLGMTYHGRPLANAYGSYFVFRKMAQDVPGFLRAVRLLALQFVVDAKAEKFADDLAKLELGEVKEKWHSDFHRFVREFDIKLQGMRLPGPDHRRELAETYRRERKKDQQFCKAVLKQFPPLPQDVERAGALIIGRYRNGIPVFVQDEEVHKGGVAYVEAGYVNDFDFNDIDKRGQLCPFHAHMRRMNPRGEIGRRGSSADDDPRAQSLKAERAYSIARRGMPYNEVDREALDARNDYRADDNGKYIDLETYRGVTPQGDARGMLFMSCQASLESFELLERSVNDPEFDPSSITKEMRRDALIGLGDRALTWPRPSGNAGEDTDYPLRSYVTSNGGFYLFAPGIEFLERIMEISTHTRGTAVR